MDSDSFLTPTVDYESLMSTYGPRSYYIFYGFLSGQANGRAFRQALQQAGFVAARSAAEADIVIGHSAGCLSVSTDLSARLVILVGMPLRNTRRFRTLLAAQHQNHVHHTHYQPAARAQASFFGLFYAITQPRRNSRIIRATAHVSQPKPPKDAHVVFIANRHDPWPRSAHLDEFIESLPFSFISLPGAHNSIWYEPALYVAIISHYAADLLATPSSR